MNRLPYLVRACMLTSTPAPLTVVASGLDWFTVSAEWEQEGLKLTPADLALIAANVLVFLLELRGGVTPQGGPNPHPAYGDQLQNRGIPDRVPAELERHPRLHRQE